MEEQIEVRIMNNGSQIPTIGFGAYQLGSPEECEKTISQALESGFRLIDTAAMYGNEVSIGRAIKHNPLSRHDIFVTSKIWHTDAGYDATMKAVERCLSNFDFDYIDMMLIHQPIGDYYGSWRALENLYDQGCIRAIGVSNFYEDRLVDLLAHCHIPPAVNQVECHLYNQRDSLLTLMRNYNIIMQAWSPFTRHKINVFNNAALQVLSEKHGKSPAQITLRWLLQRGIIALPKSSSPAHIQENYAIFDFSLSKMDMALLSYQNEDHYLENHHTATGIQRLLEKPFPHNT